MRAPRSAVATAIVATAIVACGTVLPGSAPEVPVDAEAGAPATSASSPAPPPSPTPDAALDAPQDTTPQADALMDGAAERDAPDAPDAPGDAGPEAAPPTCPATPLGTTLRSLVDSLVASTRALGGAGSGAFQVPSPAERDAFASDALAALEGDETAACRLPSGYRVVTLLDGGASIRVLAELDAAGAPTPTRFWGSYGLREGTSRALVLEAPHPVFDTNTADEAQDIFLRGEARWLLIAGAQRCANADPSPCSGTTTACGATAPYRISDAAHSIITPFHAVHRELSARDATLRFAQLHGNVAACPAALVSTSGSGSVWPATGFVRAFGDSLELGGVGVGRCGAGYPAAGCDLCGGGNVQARETAGSANACTTAAPDSGRFLHLEQLASLRGRTGGVPRWDPVLLALMVAVP